MGHFVDLHSHFLPGLDDGAGDMETALRMVQALASLGITIVLLDRAGKFQARIEGPVSGNVLLRRAQYRASERPDQIVRSIVSGQDRQPARCAATGPP